MHGIVMYACSHPFITWPLLLKAHDTYTLHWLARAIKSDPNPDPDTARAHDFTPVPPLACSLGNPNSIPSPSPSPRTKPKPCPLSLALIPVILAPLGEWTLGQTRGACCIGKGGCAPPAPPCCRANRLARAHACIPSRACVQCLTSHAATGPACTIDIDPKPFYYKLLLHAASRGALC